MAGGKKNSGLGQGLVELFGEIDDLKEEKEQNKGVEEISMDSIKPNVNQPRKTFNEENIQEIADSITEHGIIQPIIVRPYKGGYEIVAGERRYRGARKAGVKNIPCIVRELSDEENMLFAIIENMQRVDLNGIEEAKGLQSMIENFGLTQGEVAKSVGKSRPYVTNSLRTLKLPEKIQEYISEGKLSLGHGRLLLSMEGANKQIEFAKKAVEEQLSVRDLEKLLSQRGKKKRGTPRKIQKSADVLDSENRLMKTLGTKVNINKKGTKGKIEIDFYSMEELERLIEYLEEN